MIMYHVPGTVLVIEFIMVNQIGMVPAFMENNSIEEKQITGKKIFG